jgi:hypothetical protein
VPRSAARAQGRRARAAGHPLALAALRRAKPLRTPRGGNRACSTGSGLIATPIGSMESASLPARNEVARTL